MDFQCKNLETEQEKGMAFIKCLKTSKTKEILKLIQDREWENWRDWEFVIDIRGGGTVRLNPLHVAIIMQNEPVTSHILDQKDVQGLAKAKVQRCLASNTSEDNKKEDDWIYGATVMHLAARFSHQCLNKISEVDNELLGNFLIDNQTNEMQFSPLHVTAFAELHIGTRYIFI